MKTEKTTQLIADKKKEVFYVGNLNIIKKNPVIGVLASSRAPGTVVWDSYHFFYALRDANVTIAGGWHSPLEKGIFMRYKCNKGQFFYGSKRYLNLSKNLP